MLNFKFFLLIHFINIRTSKWKYGSINILVRYHSVYRSCTIRSLKFGVTPTGVYYRVPRWIINVTLTVIGSRVILPFNILLSRKYTLEGAVDECRDFLEAYKRFFFHRREQDAGDNMRCINKTFLYIFLWGFFWTLRVFS